MQVIEKTFDLGDGRPITLQTGKLAKQADGSVVVRQGNTMLLATVVAAKEAKEGTDFMPLSVEYQEKFAASGRFPGGFQKREGKPNDNEILIARLIDRALRPLFPEDFHAEVFVSVHLISADKNVMPDSLAGLAASAALTLSDVPFLGPISEVRVGRVNGKFVVNPTWEQNQTSDMDIMIGASKENIVMIEGEFNEVSESEMIEAIKIGHLAIQKQCEAQLEFAKMKGESVKRTYCHEKNDEELKTKIEKEAYPLIYEAAKLCKPKHERSLLFDGIKEKFIAEIPEITAEQKLMLERYFHHTLWQAVRDLLLNEGIRLDGRKTTDIRNISCEVDFLPAAHGSALFTRGETQSLTTVTLGTKMDEKIIDEVLQQGSEKFMLHYNFPPFATGDAKPTRGLSRREIGHGNLAHRALKRMIPNGEKNPYTVRLVSDILESNGSSSMATVCAGTLALLDTGVKIRKPVSGIAMGLVTDGKGKYAVLSDILGDEDHLGDMDFKVTGTFDGITACQMDIKLTGLTFEIMEKALAQAKVGRFHILDKMLETIAEPRTDYRSFVPRIEKIIVPKDMIGAIIGQGGKVIQEIQAQTGTVIVIEEVDKVGEVSISAPDKNSIQKAKDWINSIIEVPEVGKVYNGKIKTITDFGAFVEIMPGKEALLHISEISWSRIESMEKSGLKEGEKIQVELVEIDKKTNKMRLSHKSLLPKPAFTQRNSDSHRDNSYSRGDNSSYRDNKKPPYRK